MAEKSFDLKPRSKGLPLAVGDGFSPSYRLGFRRGARIGLIVAGFVSLFAFGLGIQFAHAETQAEKVFGKWERVTVAEIFKPVPEVENEKTARAGAVTNEYKRSTAALVQVHGFQGSKPADYVKPSK